MSHQQHASPFKHRQAFVYIDHGNAAVYLPDLGVWSHMVGPRAQGRSDGHRAALDPIFAHLIIDAIKDVETVVVAGPSTAKGELVTFCQQHQPHLAARIKRVLTCAHATQNQLEVYAREQLKAIDQWG